MKQIVIKRYPANSIRAFGVQKVISKQRYTKNFVLPLAKDSEPHLLKVGKVGADIIRGLAQLSGIEEIRIQRYQLTITIGIAFVGKWDTIQKGIATIIKKYLYPNLDESQVEVKTTW